MDKIKIFDTLSNSEKHLEFQDKLESTFVVLQFMMILISVMQEQL